MIIIDAGLLAAGIPAERRQARDLEDALATSVSALEEDLPKLQKESDSARQSIFDAGQAMDELLELGMRAEDIALAQEKFPAAAQLMDAARSANARLTTVTEEIIARSTQGVTDADDLKERVGGADARYLDAWRSALQVMIEAHTTYAGMNAILGKGLSVYEELFVLTNDYLTKQKSRFFRSLREAAGWYTLRVQEYLQSIEGFKTELEAIYSLAEEAIARAEEAFARVEELTGP